MKVILISGKAQNGKDTTAIYLKKIAKYDDKKAIIAHYADFLKEIAKNYFEWDGIKDEKGRTLLQHLGTEVFRKNNPDCWVNMMREFILGLGDTVDYVIIADCRFENEMAVVDDLGIPTVKLRIHRPNFDNGLTNEQKMHQSEIELDNYLFDYAIINDGDKQRLEQDAFYIYDTAIRKEQ